MFTFGVCIKNAIVTREKKNVCKIVATQRSTKLQYMSFHLFARSLCRSCRVNYKNKLRIENRATAIYVIRVLPQSIQQMHCGRRQMKEGNRIK